MPSSREHANDHTCETLITFGKFYDEPAMDDWEIRFRTAAEAEGAEVLLSWSKRVWPTALRRIDFDPSLPGGEPEEVAEILSSFVPEKERRKIGGWLAQAM